MLSRCEENILHPLEQINGCQWYFSVEDLDPFLHYEERMNGQDITEYNGQTIPKDRSDYRYTHGGNSYRKACEAFWEKFPEYRA